MKHLVFHGVPKGFGYTLLFLTMLICFLIYPLILQDVFFDMLHNLEELKSRPNLLYHIMEYIPLIWISFIGLFISLVNTIIYCIIDTEDCEKNTNRVLAVLCLLIACVMVAVCIIGYRNLMDLVSVANRSNTDLVVSGIRNVYLFFSFWVTILTIVTFILLLIIDVKDICVLRKRIPNTESTISKQKNIIDKKYSYLQLGLIDIPVLISSALVLFYNYKLDDSILTMKMASGHMYANIFVAGAWGIQIIYSQCVFYILMMLYYQDIGRIGHESGSEVKS